MTYAAWALEDQAGSDCPLWFVSDAKEMSRPADCREWSVSLNATEFPDRGESAAKIIAETLNAKLEKKP